LIDSTSAQQEIAPGSSHSRLIPRMGSKTSRPTPVETNTATTPAIPQDIVNEILDHLASDSNFQTLQACALVSKSCIQSCQRHLFHTVEFTSRTVGRWFETFPVPEESPAHHVRDLCVWVGGGCRVPDGFLEYIRWFTDVDRLGLVGHVGLPSSLQPAFWRLPQSVTSLALDTHRGQWRIYLLNKS